MAEIDNLKKTLDVKKVARVNETSRLNTLKIKIAKSENFLERLKKECEEKITRAENEYKCLLKSLASGQEYIAQMTTEIEKIEVMIENEGKN